MSITIKTGSEEEKVVRFILKKYPITNMEIARTLGIKLDRVNLILMKLEKRGVVQLEVLPDVWYVRLLTTNLRFVGSNPTQKKRLKHKKGKKKKKLMKKRDNYEGMMYQ